jgi:hypothetical protein
MQGTVNFCDKFLIFGTPFCFDLSRPSGLRETFLKILTVDRLSLSLQRRRASRLTPLKTTGFSAAFCTWRAPRLDQT